MKTTVNIPDDLIKEAMRITKVRNKTELIKYALYSIIQKNNLKELKQFKGQIELDIDLDTTRKRNASLS